MFQSKYTGLEIETKLDKIEDIPTKTSELINDSDYVNSDYVEAKVQRLLANTELRFFCIEPVEVVINGESTIYPQNTLVDTFLNNEDTFEVIPTSNSSISSVYAWPGALGTYYEWLEGVNLFDGVLFNMNNEDLYTKWSQGNQGLYHVQFAQYKNCIFWSDLGYISDVTKRTNYTLYYTSELPLCYSSIPDNTFKAFYFAYNVTCDPNWSNPAYKASFAKANWATQVFSYYGLHSIGLFDMDSSRFNITLPKDCRGLMYYAPNVLNAGVFDAINTTNFGAKSGSWRDAFACCYTLTNLYIKNLKVNLNISWSPINQQSLNFILSKAANTNAITIWLSPHTYYGLTDANKTLAAEKNITLSLIDTNTTEDNRLHMLQMTGNGNSFLANDGSYKTIDEQVTTITSEMLQNYPTIEEVANMIEQSTGGLEFPIYLETEPYGGEDFRRREADDLTLAIIEWYDANRTYVNPDVPSAGSYIDPSVLAGKIFIDGGEVLSMEWTPNVDRNCLILTTSAEYDYIAEPWVVLQYVATTTINKGTIDIM